ncbi:ABC transporter ATP-binding protein [bacterium]|nr:ABC transporter ATP-binding protein [bacterium]
MKVELQGVHKYYEARSGPVKILENINLVIPHGDFVSIMGPSGSGKTSLLNLIGCIDKPGYGKIFLDENDVSGAGEHIREQIRLRHIGFVFQGYNLLPTLTVLENVLLPMQLSNRVQNKAEQIKQAMAFLRLVGLDARAKDSVLKLSGGQQQRVAIARALSNLPGLILADEPTGNLDERSSKEVMDVFRVINENQHITTVMVTHDSKAASFAKRVLYLESGQLTERRLV